MAVTTDEFLGLKHNKTGLQIKHEYYNITNFYMILVLFVFHKFSCRVAKP